MPVTRAGRAVQLSSCLLPPSGFFTNSSGERKKNFIYSATARGGAQQTVEQGGLLQRERVIAARRCGAGMQRRGLCCSCWPIGVQCDHCCEADSECKMVRGERAEAPVPGSDVSFRLDQKTGNFKVTFASREMQWSALTEEKQNNQLAQIEFRFIKTIIKMIVRRGNYHLHFASTSALHWSKRRKTSRSPR